MNFYEGCTKLDNGKYLIRENFTITADRISKSERVTENKVLIEGRSVNTKSCYTLKVWEKGVRNGNGRLYDEVIEEVLRDGISTLAFVNHPDEDTGEGAIAGEPDLTRTYAVQKNPRMIETWLCIDVYPVGTAGKLFEDIIETGGPIAISSSALGELNEDGYVRGGLDESGSKMFTLERWGDWVYTPSNGVTFFKENYKNIVKETCNEPSPSKTNYSNKSNSLNSKDKEENMVENKKEELIEKNLILNIKTLIKDADSKADLNEQLEAYEEIVPFLDAVNLKEKEAMVVSLSEKIKSTQDSISELTEKGKQVEGLSEKIELSSKENEELVKSIEEGKEKLTIIEQNREELTERVIILTDEVETSKATIIELEEKYSNLTEAYETMRAGRNSRVEAEKFIKATEIAEQFKEKVKILISEKEKLTSKIKFTEKKKRIEENKEKVILQKKNEGLKERVTNIKEDKLELEAKLTEANKEITKLRKQLAEKKAFEHKTVEIKEKAIEIQSDSDIEVENILEFVKDVISGNSKLKEYEKDLLTSSSLEEAQMKVINLKGSIENLGKSNNGYIKESTNNIKRASLNNNNNNNKISNEGWF